MTEPPVKCCEKMVHQLTQVCDVHTDPMDCPDALVIYWPVYRAYGLPVRDDKKGRASSIVAITFCPWCGHKLPQNLSDNFWQCLEEAGFPEPGLNTLHDPNLPDEFRSDAWWKLRGL